LFYHLRAKELMEKKKAEKAQKEFEVGIRSSDKNVSTYLLFDNLINKI
jgi:hypothetical protein